MSDVNVVFQVISKDKPHEVTSRQSGEKHRIAEAKVGDDTGIVIIPLWDESIQMVKRGETYALRKGYTDEYRGSLRLKIGRYSELDESECEIGEIKHGISKSSSDPLQRYYHGTDTHFVDRLGYSGYNDFRGHRRDP
jgi:replication factor A1